MGWMKRTDDSEHDYVTESGWQLFLENRGLQRQGWVVADKWTQTLGTFEAAVSEDDEEAKALASEIITKHLEEQGGTIHPGAQNP